ncbi:MAG: hypothetical protein WBV74_05370 [Pseudonocardiaceae bacterium]
MTTAGLKQKNPSLLQRVIDRFRREHDLSKPTSPKALSLTLALRRLWADHVVWTREYVVAAISDAPDAGAVAGRLLKNQEDIGNAVVPFYGEAAGSRLTELLKEHVMMQHLTLTKNEAVARLKGRWEDDIEAFDQIFTEILTVADVLAAGIVKQFPNKF